MLSQPPDDPRDPATLTSPTFNTLDEAAAWLQTEEDEVRELIDAGTLDTRTFGGQPWITRESLRAVMEDRE